MIDLQAERPAARQGHPLNKVPPQAQPFQKSDHLPGITSLLPLRALQAVQFFQHRQRQHNMIVFKRLQGVGCLNQYVGIQHIGFLHCCSCLSV